MSATAVSNELNSVQTVVLSNFDSASITAAYQSINGTGISNDVKILRIINNSDTSITISYDGVSDADVILSASAETYEFQANSRNVAENPGTLYVRKGQIIYAKGTAGTGSIHVGGYR